MIIGYRDRLEELSYREQCVEDLSEIVLDIVTWGAIGYYPRKVRFKLMIVEIVAFNRVLVAQTINHSLILMSRDRAFDAYSIERVWS
jgi:hypothetical protein